MKVILPGSAIGLLGGGENSRMFALAAYRMGYRVHVYSTAGAATASPLAHESITAPYEDLDRVREFAAGVDVLTVVSGDVPAITLRAAAGSSVLCPSVKVFEAVENGIGNATDKPREAAGVIAEFSIVGARSANGDCVFYDPIAIDRTDGVLDIARSPAPIGARVARQAVGLTRDTLEDLDLTGVACVEFILTQEHELVVHEVTPHPHRSGHLTVDTCVTSQFEQQLRAVCSLPLGSTEMLRPAAMAVLPEAIWQNGAPDWAAACAFPEVKLHLYGARSGHLTAIAASGTLAKQIARAARCALAPRSPA